ncbi:MAG: AI-2E family transporter, partial [Terrimicrobiaceae bacterium]|nr:AI-2E family transporter [Terrimicrobiaceae bacterium]
MSPPEHPTPFQKKMFWAAVTTLSFVAIAVTVWQVGVLVVRAISFLQPVLIPVAVAGILAYLLDPVVNWLEKRRLSRTRAVLVVFGAFTLLIVSALVTIVPPAWRQGERFAKDLPGYAARAQDLVNRTVAQAEQMARLPLFHRDKSSGEGQETLAGYVERALDDAISSAQKQIPTLAIETGKFIQRSVGGFLGVFGTLLSLVLVPVFLFFFLKEGPLIARHWSEYLPLRASPLKSEIVSLLTEINSYLINFFRGQLLVSMIDGAIIAALLLVVGLDFALVIGLMVAVLGLIPYAGVFISWIPAVIIAAAQFGDWWHPLLVTIIFLVVNNLDGIVIAPKIVGESVGLHPLTVIISVLAWSLILGGLLGALLAVP